jgi:hypothetical protein
VGRWDKKVNEVRKEETKSDRVETAKTSARLANLYPETEGPLESDDGR